MLTNVEQKIKLVPSFMIDIFKILKGLVENGKFSSK